jgi:glycosyltransferase involved in cell wall biosynthesis
MNQILTVLTPVFNGERYLEETIQSVLAALPDNSEYIVINDGSTDSTSSILENFPNIKVVTQANSGEPSAVNTGYAFAEGKYVCIVNADDLVYPEIFNESIRLLESKPNLTATYPDWDMIDDQGNKISSIKTLNYSEEILISNFKCIPGPGAVFKNKVISGSLRNTQLKFTGDYDQWLRLSLHGDFERIQQNLAAWRSHAEALSSQRGVAMANERVYVIQNHFEELEELKLTNLVRFKYKRKALGAAQYQSALLSIYNPKFSGKKLLFKSYLNNYRLKRRKIAVLFIMTAPLSRFIWVILQRLGYTFDTRLGTKAKVFKR